MSKYRRAELQLSTASQLVSTSADSLRTWVVSVQTLVDGQIININSVGSNIHLETAFTEIIEIDEVFGLPDPRIAVFRVSELAPVPGGLGVPLEVRVVPRYPDHVMEFFKLDDKLAALVGLPYLAHPKSSMNQIYTYIEANNLMTKKYIMCDKFLADIFGVSWLRLRTLWESISARLISKVEATPLYNQLVLDHAPRAKHSAQTLNVDAELNLYPQDWHLREAEGRVVTRTKSMSQALTKPARSLKRHRSV